MAGPLHNVRDISQIAYGFIASKVLFAALDLDLFGSLAAAPKTRTSSRVTPACSGSDSRSC